MKYFLIGLLFIGCGPESEGNLECENIPTEAEVTLFEAGEDREKPELQVISEERLDTVAYEGECWLVCVGELGIVMEPGQVSII